MCRRDYVDAGQVVIPARLNDTLLPRWIGGQKTLRLAATRHGRARLADAFYFADEDIVNPVMAAELADGEVDIRPHRLAPSNGYAELMTRLLLSPDVAVALVPADLPLRLRHCTPARLERRGAHAQSAVRRAARRGFGVLGIRTRRDDRRRRSTAR